MSLIEMKNELRRLTFEERAEIARLLLELDELEKKAPRPVKTFAEAKAYVFENYGELLRRLAQ